MSHDPLARVTHDPNEVVRLYEQGAGVYVTVNETDLRGRKSENIIRVRAVWQEDDDGFDGALPLEPSMVVETSPGHFHRYWLVEDDWPADEQGRADFASVMERMVESYGSDPNAKDITRVLRLPGFLNRKNPERPFMVRMVEASGRRYTREEIMRAFPPVECEKPRQRHEFQPGNVDETRIAEALRFIPADDRYVWLQIGMALKDELGDRGRHLWDGWSSHSEKFDAKDQEKTWRSFHGNGIRIGTLFHHAKQYGWTPPRESPQDAKKNNATPGIGPTSSSNNDWPEPKPLPSGLAPVDPFDLDFLPSALGPWVSDIAERLQCPPDYIAVTAVTALGSLIGRRVGIKPQLQTDWVEYPNLWAMFIGPPGMMKSPAMNEALKPLHYLEGESLKDYEVAKKAYDASIDQFKLRRSVKRALDQKALKEQPNADEIKSQIDLGDEPQEPVPVRYRTNDSSYEALGELLIANPKGILIERDEVISLLKHHDHEEEAVARGFYMSAWSGTQPYTFDRIGRGHRHVEAVTLSIVGSTQPSRVAEYIRRANADAGGGDGLIQRFGLLVWPDRAGDWRDVDRYPETAARRAAWGAFERIAELDEQAILGLGANKGPFDKTPHLRFDESAAAEFRAWREEPERRLRSGELSPALEGHLAKFRKVVPAIALINHVVDGGQAAIGSGALLKALAFARYLESHARRVYGAAGALEVGAGKAILEHIRRGDLQDGFSARDIQRHDWSRLTDRGHIRLGLNLLVDLDHLAANTAPGTDRGGRPKITYSINPKERRV